MTSAFAQESDSVFLIHTFLLLFTSQIARSQLMADEILEMGSYVRTSISEQNDSLKV